MAVNPAMQIGVIAASAPPTITASARPLRISSNPSPIAVALAAHAVTGADVGPMAPMSMAISPAAILGIIIGHMYGLTRSGPLSRMVWKLASKLAIPPIPVPYKISVARIPRAEADFGSFVARSDVRH